MTCLQGASLAGMTLGKKLPTSASMGSIFNLSMKLVGVCGLEQGADAVGDGVERVGFEGEVHAAFAAELVHQDSGAGMAFYVFEEECGAAGFGCASAELGGAVGDLGHLEVWGTTSAVMRLSSPAFSSVLDPVAQVGVGQLILLGWVSPIPGKSVQSLRTETLGLDFGCYSVMLVLV